MSVLYTNLQETHVIFTGKMLLYTIFKKKICFYRISYKQVSLSLWVQGEIKFITQIYQIYISCRCFYPLHLKCWFYQYVCCLVLKSTILVLWEQSCCQTFCLVVKLLPCSVRSVTLLYMTWRIAGRPSGTSTLVSDSEHQWILPHQKVNLP